MARIALRHKIAHLVRYLAYWTSYTLNYPLTYPKDVNFQMTNRCPLRCAMCNIPRLKPAGRELAVKEMKGVIDEMAEWGTRYVSFVGGEALVRKRATLELIEYAASKGLHTTLFSSGLPLNRRTCKTLLDAGLSRLAISLDGAREQTHDLIRGKGSFKRAMGALATLLEMRANGDYGINLDISTVILSYNFRELVDIHELGKGMGIDQLFLQALVLDNTYRGAVDYSSELWIDEKEIGQLRKIVKDLIALKRRDGLIFNSVKYLQSIPEYFELKDRFRPGRCLAGFMSINIDPYGNISICGLGPNINVRDGELRRLWTAKRYKMARLRIKRCTVPCLMLCYEKFEPKELLRYLIS